MLSCYCDDVREPAMAAVCVEAVTCHGAAAVLEHQTFASKVVRRPRPDRYAFRAGWNLPDMEFRYLRTVIVTVAVPRGFGRRLPSHQVTNFLDLPAPERRQPPYMVLRLCGDCVFGKRSPGSGQSATPLQGGTPSPEVTGLFCRVP
ncbi:hypothetical protein Scep_001885 [Stephania cephalantha]|uniref:Uncharacterized protein n=1 Tax=Stephania cephalantha TaxID=152367 RepID=A0AAP0LCV8_9MAGN